MDIAALSKASAQLTVSDQASILIMKKAMDTSVTQQQNLLDQLPAAEPRISPSHLGNSIDISA